MFLYFNSNGQLLERLEHGPQARAGTTNFEIFAYFEGVDIETTYTAATITLEKPDLLHTSYPALLMERKTINFEPLSGENPTHFERNHIYKGYYFNFYSFTTNQTVEVLLDTIGNWGAVIKLYGANRNVSVQGQATFNVGQGTESEDGNSVELETILNTIYLNLAEKLDIDSAGYIKVIDSIPEAGTVLDENVYNINDILFNKADNSFYKLLSLTIVNGNPEKILSFNGLLLNNLDDVSISSPAANEILKFNGNTSKWENVKNRLSALEDIDFSTLSNGQVLKYNSTTQKWENADNTIVLPTDISCSTLFADNNIKIAASSSATRDYVSFKNNEIKMSSGHGSSTKLITIQTATGYAPLSVGTLNAATNIDYGKIGFYSEFTPNCQSEFGAYSFAFFKPGPAPTKKYCQYRYEKGFYTEKPLIASTIYDVNENALMVSGATYLTALSGLEVSQSVLLDFHNSNDNDNCSTAVGLVLRKGSTEFGSDYIVIGTNMQVYDANNQLVSINRIAINYTTGEVTVTGINIHDEHNISSATYNHQIDIYNMV